MPEAELDGRIHVWQALRACSQPNLNYPMPEAELDGRIQVWQALRACNQPNLNYPMPEAELDGRIHARRRFAPQPTLVSEPSAATEEYPHGRAVRRG